MARARVVAATWAWFLATACAGAKHGTAAEDVSGKYTVTVTDQSNDCGYSGWPPGHTQQVTFDVTQSGSSIHGNVENGGGLVGAVLDVFGIGSFDGTVNGANLEMTYDGPTTGGGKCAYSVHAAIEATLDGNTLSGTITYTNHTNQQCGVLDACTSTRTFVGTRPPK